MSASILQYEEAAHRMMHRGAHFAQGSPVVVLDDGYWLLCHASSVAHPMDPPPPIHMLSNSSGLKPLVSFVFNPLFNVDIVMSTSAVSFSYGNTMSFALARKQSCQPRKYSG